MKIKTTNPYTEEIISEYELLDDKQINSEVVKSRKAYLKWKETSIDERIKLFRNISAQLRKNTSEYAKVITTEMGKPIRQSIAEVEKSALLVDYYADNLKKMLEPEIVKTEAEKTYISFEPIGIVLAIMPWNYPFWQVFRFAIPAIASGNVVFLKHASNVPASAIAIEEIFKNSGFEENVFRTLIIDSKSAMNLIEDDKVDAVSLTGSNYAGEQVGAISGKKIKPLVLELGGSDPFIVFEDADLEKAVELGLKSRLISNGQSCIAAKRFIVIDKIADKFKKLMIEKLSKLKVGNPMDESIDIGPIAKKEFCNELEAQLLDAKNKGAEIFRIKTENLNKGYFFSPAIVTNVKNNMKIITEEVFGPIAPIIIVKNESDAIKTANDTQFGLGASVWTKDLALAERVAKKLECGCVVINDMVKSDPRLPFGGIKKSGVGRELSYYGLKEFVNIKTIVVNKG